MKKRIVAVVVAILAMLIVVGIILLCSKGENNTSNTSEAVSAEAETSEVSEAEKDEPSQSVSESEPVESSEAAVESESVAGSESQEVSEPESSFVADRSEVFEMFADMTVGWNLGNTMDAHGVKDVTAETYWGNPKTTQEMIDAVAAKGFNTIRIPVTWKDHVGSAPEYKIDEEWLNRVQEIVDYCVANDLYIIVDTHHEPDGWLLPVEDKYEEVSAQLKAIWTQVAERFKDYSNKLIFEGMNEPRIKGSPAEWNGGTAKERAVVDKLNQDFVDAVRATGGNNETRCLIICAYGNNGGYQILSKLKLPQDNHIAVAVHLYTPYFFTYEPADGNINEWTGGKKAEIVSAMKQVNVHLIQRGVPAIITEFGAVHKTYEKNGEQVDNEPQVLLWLEDYLTSTEEFGIPCIWWDNGIYDKSGEKFGIFDRRSCIWYSENIANKLIELTK